jgi:hypothetical protein
MTIDREAGAEAPDRPRTFTVWLIALSLVLNGLYLSYVAVQSLSISLLSWAALSLVSAWGIWKLQAWSRYSIALIAVFSLAAWVDGTAQNYRKGLWPFEDTLSTVLSFVPALFLIVWWVAITIHAFRLFSPRSR